MAEATTSLTTKAVVSTKIVKVINLVLTEEEAQALRTVCYFIGGDPQNSRRCHIDAIEKALRNVVGYDKSDISTINRSIWFNDEKVKAQ